MHENFFSKIIFLLASWRSMMKIEEPGSGSMSQSHGSANPHPDPHQNVMDPEHCHNRIRSKRVHATQNCDLAPCDLSNMIIISNNPLYSCVLTGFFVAVRKWIEILWSVERIFCDCYVKMLQWKWVSWRSGTRWTTCGTAAHARTHPRARQTCTVTWTRVTCTRAATPAPTASRLRPARTRSGSTVYANTSRKLMDC
jgi:hypothetical protein